MAKVKGAGDVKKLGNMDGLLRMNYLLQASTLMAHLQPTPTKSNVKDNYVSSSPSPSQSISKSSTCTELSQYYNNVMDQVSQKLVIRK